MNDKRIFWDTNLFIYQIEENPQYSGFIEEILDFQTLMGYEIITSTLTLGEILVKPYKENRQDLVVLYNFLLPQLTLIELSVPVALEFASLRAKYNIKSPDAIQVACAKIGKAELFVTNDDRLEKLNSPQLQIISLSGFIKRIRSIK